MVPRGVVRRYLGHCGGAVKGDAPGDEDQEFLGATRYCRRVKYERISVDPARMGGLPCIRDTRVTVTAVLGQLAAGRSVEQVLADYPYLERADVYAALAFAAEAVQERELPLAAA